jgi:hypothetical protein
MKLADARMKIVLAHEDPVTGLKAIELLRRLAARLGAQSEIDRSPWELCNRAWQFDWLREPELFEQALAEAIEADMIIISANRRNELPVCVRKWIESVLARKRGGPAALVALLDGPPVTNDDILHSDFYLRQLASENGVDFHCNLDQWPPCGGPLARFSFARRRRFASGRARGHKPADPRHDFPKPTNH